jgi:thiamine biosynthesis lipoprotein
MRRLIALTCLALAACTGDETTGDIELAGSTMGTQYSIKLPYPGIDLAALESEIEAAFADVNGMMSTYLPDSEISRFNDLRSTDWHPVSGAFCLSVEKAQEISAETGGAFDITVAPLVNLWGFGPGEAVDEPPSDEAIAAMMESIGYDKLHTNCGAPALKKDVPELMLDMSAFGKGFAADRVATLLDQEGFKNYLIEVGGELRVRGRNIKDKKWAIGIELPLTDQRRPHTRVLVTNTALATSGDYRNFFVSEGQRYSHTIDTRTGKPVTHDLASVTVLDPRGYRADALATALLVMGPEAGLAFAEAGELAVLFLVREDDGFRELTTPAFDQLRAET